MKKIREQNEHVQEQSLSVIKRTDHLIKENEKFRLKHQDAINTSIKLQQTEIELEALKKNFAETDQALKVAKFNEVQYLKDISQLKTELAESKSNQDQLAAQLKANSFEIKKLTSQYERALERSKELESNLEVANQENLELTSKLMESNELLERNERENSKAIENLENTIDNLRHELKSTALSADQKKIKDTINELTDQIDELDAKNEELEAKNFSQAQEIADNKEEIALLEEEIKSIKQFIKDKSQSLVMIMLYLSKKSIVVFICSERYDESSSDQANIRIASAKQRKGRCPKISNELGECARCRRECDGSIGEYARRQRLLERDRGAKKQRSSAQRSTRQKTR